MSYVDYKILLTKDRSIEYKCRACYMDLVQGHKESKLDYRLKQINAKANDITGIFYKPDHNCDSNKMRLAFYKFLLDDMGFAKFLSDQSNKTPEFIDNHGITVKPDLPYPLILATLSGFRYVDEMGHDIVPTWYALCDPRISSIMSFLMAHDVRIVGADEYHTTVYHNSNHAIRDHGVFTIGAALEYQKRPWLNYHHENIWKKTLNRNGCASIFQLFIGKSGSDYNSWTKDSFYDTSRPLSKILSGGEGTRTREELILSVLPYLEGTK